MKPTLLKRAFLAGTAAGAFLAIAGTAAAQETPPQPADAAPSADAAPADVAQGNEIIVTAQRRAQRLQDVPLSISVQTGKSLEAAGISEFKDLTIITPGLFIGATGPNIEPAVRGISTQEANPGNESNIAVYLDGVYQPSQFSNQFELPDIERVEVLKGPQGTTFGRNATGGAIQIFTKAPSFTPTGELSASYGRFDNVDIHGYLSGPLSGDKLAASISGFYRYSSGYYNDVIRGGKDFGYDSWGTRGKLLAEPTDNFKALLTLSYVHRYDATGNAGTALNGNSFGRLFPGAISPSKPRDVSTNLANAGAYVRSLNASLKMDWEIGPGTVTSTTGYARDRTRNLIEGDYTNADVLQYDIFLTGDSYSQEFLFSSNKIGPATVVAGVFLYHAVAKYDPLNVTGSLGGVAIYGRQQADAASVFGEVNFDITDRLVAIAGARYSYERRKGSVSFGALGGAAPPLVPFGKKGFENFTPRLALRYEILPKTNVYANYSKGFKSGGYVVNGTPDFFKPEKVSSYEIGLKTNPGIFTANLSAFYYDYTDLQVNIPKGTQGVTGNAGAARLYGFEGDVSARPVQGLTLTAGLSWLDATFRDYPNAVGNVPVLNPDGTPCLCGNTSITFDARGNTLLRAPKLTLSTSASYVAELAHGKLELSGNVFRSSRLYLDTLNRRDTSQSPYWLVNARAAYTFGDSGFNLFVYGKNLSNETVIASTFLNQQADGLSYNAPRTYGVGAKYSF